MFLDNFLSFLKHEKRYSPNTIIAYQTDLLGFFDFLKGTYAINNEKEIGHIHIRSWIVDLMNNDISPKSINRKLSSLKSYYKYLIKKGVLTKNPTLKVLSPKTAKKLPVYVEKNSTEMLLNQLPANNFDEARNKLAIELLYCTGMRRAELINLKESDIDFNKSQVKVLGKGNKERIIPIGGTLLFSIRKYLQLKEENFVNEYLLVTDSGKQLYPNFIYRIVRRYLSQVTTVDKKSPHILRHTFATHLVNNGADLNAVKELLGHASLAATQIYTHNNIEKLKDIYKNSHPKA